MRTLIHLWVEPMIMNHQRCAEKVFFDYIIEGDFTNLSNQKIDDIILGSKMQDIMDFADIDSNWDYGVLYAKATNKKPSISFAKSEEEIVREKEQKQALVKLEKESRKLDAEIQKIVSGKKDLVLTKENLTMQDNGIIDINVPSLKLTDKFDFSKIWDTIENKFLGKIKDGDRITLTDSDGNKIFDMQGGGCLNVGLAETEPTIRKALAIGADDAIRINAEPSDSFFVAAQIADQAKAGNYDLILMGRESIDYNSGVVHSIVGEMLGIPSVSPVMKLELDGNKAKLVCEIEGGKENLEVNLPFVAGCQEPIAEWKIPNMRGIMAARTKPLKVVEPAAVDKGTTLKSFELPPAKGAVKMISADNVAELVTLLKTEAKVL